MIVSNVDMIEAVGGGSCRCMLVENWSTTVAVPADNTGAHFNLKVNVLAACLSETGSSESSAVDSCADLDSSRGSFEVKRLDDNEDFFFSEPSQEQKEVLNPIAIQKAYWDQHFINDLDFDESPYTGDLRFNFQVQKRYPLSKKKFASLKDMIQTRDEGNQASDRECKANRSQVKAQPYSFQNLLRSVSSVFTNPE